METPNTQIRKHNGAHVIIDAVSDMHGELPIMDEGDVLIVAGDCTTCDKVSQWVLFFEWFKAQKYTHKILVAGNHDRYLERCLADNEADEMGLLADYDERGFHYLKDSGIEIDGVKLWGTPWTNWFPRINPLCASFTGTEKELKEQYAKIPEGTDVLISHGPMWGTLDAVPNFHTGKVEFLGSRALKERIEVIKPKVHIFGHIHEMGGSRVSLNHENGKQTECYNVAIMDGNYDPIHKPTRIVL